MPQNPLRIPTINEHGGLTSAATPLNSALTVEVQSGGTRMQTTVADIIGGGGGVAGGGTTADLARWVTSDTLSNSIISDDGSTATVSGGFVVTGNETVDGNLVTSGGATVDGNLVISGTTHLVGANTFDGATTQTGVLTLGSFGKLHSYTLAQANAATPSANDVCVITDSSVTTWGSIVVATGTDHVVAWFDGTNWSVIGKVGA